MEKIIEGPPPLKSKFHVLIAIMAIYTISWISPVYGHTNSTGYDPINIVKGYDAYRFTSHLIFNLWDRLFNDGTGRSFGDLLQTIAIALGPHTNYIFVIGLLLLIFNKRGFSKKITWIFRILLFVCIPVNLSYLTLRVVGDHCYIGYYLWLISFLLLWIAWVAVVPISEKRSGIS